MSTLTLDAVSEEIASTIDKLERLQKLYEAMASQEHRRVKKLIDEYNDLKRAEKAKEK